MSEPVKNAEIEDVLSSIRRLVSGENRVAPDAASPRPRPADRLVLTPALRVADPTEAREETPQDAPSQVAEDADAAPWSDPDATLYDAAGIAEPQDDPGDTAVGSQADHGHDRDHASQHDGGAQDHASEGDGDADRQDDWRDGAQGADDRPAEVSDDLGARIAALEEVIARKDDHWEPDTPGSDDYAGTEVETLEWEDTGDDAPGPEPEPRAAPAEAVEDAPDLLAEDPVLDEAALRELVADIVRQELQGALGERITRNVRKLVRREIQRATTLQDLE